ncbi:MAG: hypothetical protein AAF211_03495 [Myxococcota bacterium]
MMIAIVALAGCSREPIEFPASLAPLEENRAEWPGDGTDFPEEIATAGGDSPDREYYWGHGRAYLRHPVDEVWTASQDIDACVDRRESDEWEAIFDTQPQFDASYTIAIRRAGPPLPVNWEMTWVHERQLATPDDETLRVVVQSERSGGSSLVGNLRGSLVIEEIEPGISSLEFVQIGTQRAQNTDFAVSISFVEDYFADIKALVKGQPLPEYDR